MRIFKVEWLFLMALVMCGWHREPVAHAVVTNGETRPSTEGIALVEQSERTNSIGMKFKLISPGTFKMGSDFSKPPEYLTHFESIHQVTLTQPFLLGMYEVTQDQYQLVMGSNPSKNQGLQNPVERVSWEDAVEFCRKLSELPKEKAAGNVYRLPTEAEWEYACRAGAETEFCFGSNNSALGDYAWFRGNSEGQVHPVGQKKPNAWGLHDMHGNVFEWCQDWHGQYASDSVVDPVGPDTGEFRVMRGGAWVFDSVYCRSAYRLRYHESFASGHVGFRVVWEPSRK